MDKTGSPNRMADTLLGLGGNVCVYIYVYIYIHIHSHVPY